MVDCVSYSSYNGCTSSQYVTWVYQNFESKVAGYWTMTSHPDNSSKVFAVSSIGKYVPNNSVTARISVRPVINLLNSAIE